MSKQFYVDELTALFEEAGLSNTELARRCEVSQGHMSKVLRGLVMPSEGLLDKICLETGADRAKIGRLYLLARGTHAGSPGEDDEFSEPLALMKNHFIIVEFDETLHLDSRVPYNEETRFIHATRQGVRHMRLSSVQAPKDGEVPRVEVVAREGCKIIEDESEEWGGQTTIAEFADEVPMPGKQPHRFRIERRVVSGRMFPANVITLSLPTKLIRSRIKFDTSNLPSLVQVIQGENQSSLRSYVPGRLELTPDSTGLVVLPDVRNPKEGLSYGAIWKFDS